MTDTEQRPLVAVVATGGTIAQARDPGGGGVLPAVGGEALLAAVPGLPELARIELHQLCNIDSRDMQPQIWLDLARLLERELRRPELAGAVVLHGTDTMEDTAFFLDRVLPDERPVVLTGAMKAADSPFADGPENILEAVRLAAAAEGRGLGTVIAFHRQVFDARNVIKAGDAGGSVFTAGPWGPLAALTGAGPRRVNLRHRPPPIGLPPGLHRAAELPRVDIVPDYPGADGALVDAAIAAGARGLVVVGHGSGNVSRPIFDAILRARAAGLAVAVCSRVPYGRLAAAYGGPGGGDSLLAAGAVLGADISAGKNRILLMLGLAHGMTAAGLQHLFASH